MIKTENLEPGTSLANVIGKDRSSTNIYQRIQPISSIRSNTDSERQSLNDLENMKYKTELCRNYSTYGYCSYSSRCQFAHGFQELRCRTRHPKYKTEFCRNFLSGFCKYGSRCQFLHHSINSTETSISNSTQSYSTAAAVETYLLTNMLAQSTALESFNHQSALATLATYANISSLTESSRKQHTTFPLTCANEMHQLTPLHFSCGMSIPYNNNSAYPRATTHGQSSLSSNQILDTLGEQTNIIVKKLQKSSEHI